MTRTDIHRPSALIVEDYVYICNDHVKMDTMGDVPYLREQMRVLEEHQDRTGGTFSDHEYGGSCMVCGASCQYTAVFYHEKSNSYVRTGFDCASKLAMGDQQGFKTFRTYIRAALDRQAGKEKAQKMLDLLGLGAAWGIYVSEYVETEDQQLNQKVFTVRDMVSKLVQYGDLSDKALDYLYKLIDQITRWPQILEERRIKDAQRADVPTGRVQVTGTILSMKTVETNYGLTPKILVESDTGYKVYGTQPSSLFDGEPKEGRKVQFTATIQPSDKDPKFGFFKRPTKAQYV